MTNKEPGAKEAPSSQPTKQSNNRIRDDGKLVSRSARRMEARILFLENQLAIAKLWIADLYDQLKASKQGTRV